MWPDTKNEVNEKSKTFVDMETQTDSIKFVDVETQTETIKKKKLIKKFWKKGKEKSMQQDCISKEKITDTILTHSCFIQGVY